MEDTALQLAFSEVLSFVLISFLVHSILLNLPHYCTWPKLQFHDDIILTFHSHICRASPVDPR